jgi:hypothetical protein
MYYKKQFKNKPTSSDTKKIQGYTEKATGIYHKPLIIKTEIEIEDLANGLSHGATFKPALLNGSKNIDWISQQLFALDFDNDIDKKTHKDNRTTLQEQINICKEHNILPVFGYYSFSSTPESPRWRLIFCTDKVITDKEIRNKLQLTLIHLFDKSDKLTFDETRMFYGGRSLIPFDYSNRINADAIINTYWNDSFAVPTKNKSSTSHNKDLSAIKKSTISISTKKDSEMNLKIEAIKSLNVDVMRMLLKGVTNKEEYISSSISDYFQCKSQAQVYKTINEIDLQEYLGIYGFVNCILPEHDDSTPSAHIYVTPDGTQIYKCLGCGKAYTIISITEKLAQCKRSKAIEFIKKVYGIELIESDWTKQWKQKLDDCCFYLDSEDFEITNPQLSKLIRTRKSDLKCIIQYFKQYVNEDMQVDGKPFFFASYDKLMKICGKNDKTRIAQDLTLFALLNMIIKLQTDDIPEKQLNEAKHIAATYGHKKLTGFYSFEEYGTLLFEESEEIAKKLKQNHMTLKGLSREYIIRTFGNELANKVYPQYKYETENIGVSKKSDEKTAAIANSILNQINTQGYATEKQVTKELGNSYKTQIKKCIQEILNKGNLIQVKASKINKEKYHIQNDELSYQTNIIVNK